MRETDPLIARRKLLAFGLGLGAFGASAGFLGLPGRAAASLFGKGTVTAESGSGAYRFNVRIAGTEQARIQGLQGVRYLGARDGMWFDFGRSRKVSMWMKNTFISLDMVFVRDDGTVAGVIRGTTPKSLKQLTIDEPVRYVLEVTAGVTRAIGLKPGDRVTLD
ncbi:MAG: DUF192 domain-containing protein [Magnetovibrionaceae bacterium]